MWERYCRVRLKKRKHFENPILKQKKKGVNAIVFVVDSADVAQFETAQKELHELVAKPPLQGIPLLVRLVLFFCLYVNSFFSMKNKRFWRTRTICPSLHRSKQSFSN